MTNVCNLMTDYTLDHGLDCFWWSTLLNLYMKLNKIHRVYLTTYVYQPSTVLHQGIWALIFHCSDCWLTLSVVLQYARRWQQRLISVQEALDGKNRSTSSLMNMFAPDCIMHPPSPNRHHQNDIQPQPFQGDTDDEGLDPKSGLVKISSQSKNDLTTKVKRQNVPQRFGIHTCLFSSRGTHQWPNAFPTPELWKPKPLCYPDPNTETKY